MTDIFSDPFKLITIIGTIVTILGALITNIPKLRSWWLDYWKRRSLKSRLGAELYTPEDILNATRYYIKPHCQDVDPTQEEEIRHVHGAKQDLFEAVDEMLANPSKYKLILVLADSGMGKTSFVLNYYAYHWRKRQLRKRFNLALVPLGSDKADEHIKKIKNQSETTIFLDAFDEDARAIKDHRKRLNQLLGLCGEFRQVLITSRTQFFPREEEIPRETGILKVGITEPGDTRVHIFYKLYLSPFSDAEIKSYLKRCFSLWHLNQRQKAFDLIKKVPLLTVRPMLLANIPYLVKLKTAFRYSVQIYEAMINGWLTREQPFVEKEVLREFSERLAVDLFLKREQRGFERIPAPDLEPLAQSFNIKLQDWQLRGRSLLNRDANGNYKFAHRSILEYLFVQRFLATAPEQRPKMDWTDQMYLFLREKLDECQDRGKNLPNLTGIDLSKVIALKLRKKPEEISERMTKKMLAKLNYYDSRWHKTGKGIRHLYYRMPDKEGVIFDLATGLMWQQSGSTNYMEFKDAKNWLDQLNRDGFAGYHDWRLPTLEEAMSLMEPEQKNAGLYIDPAFDTQQRYIWTSDPVAGGSGRVWVVFFGGGFCFLSFVYDSDGYYVRAVRSGQSSP